MSSFGTTPSNAFAFTQFGEVANNVLPINQGKLINIGNNGAIGSTTVVNIGTPNGGATILNVYGVINVAGATAIAGLVRPVPTILGQSFLDLNLGPYGQPIWCGQLSPAIWINAAGVVV